MESTDFAETTKFRSLNVKRVLKGQTIIYTCFNYFLLFWEMYKGTKQMQMKLLHVLNLEDDLPEHFGAQLNLMNNPASNDTGI